MGSFFAELKRRHIYRVAAAYAVVAWVLLQIVNNVAPILDLPPWVARAFLLALIVGLPITLLIAWTRQLAPADVAASPKTSTLDWTLIGALIVVIGLVSYQQLAPSRQGAIGAAAPPAPQSGAISIAVLPFSNLSSDPEQEFFSDGVTEEIGSALAKVPNLRMVGRTSAFQYKGENRDLRAIGQALGAAYLIEGSVRKAGDRVRVTAQLVKAGDGIGLWTENYDRDLADIFRTQEDIAQAIATALKVPLGLQQSQTLVISRTRDLDSYQQYLRAKALYRSRGEGISQAVTILEALITRDANYAPAWGLLARAYLLLPVYETGDRVGSVEDARREFRAAIDKAEAAARRSIQMDSKSALGYAALANIETTRGKLVESEHFYEQALAADSNDPDVLHGYSQFLDGVGRLKESLNMREQLRRLEPFVPVYNYVTAAIMQQTGEFQASIPIVEALPPGARSGRAYLLAQAYAAAGRYADAADSVLLVGELTSSQAVQEAARLLRAAPAKAIDPVPDLERLYFVYGYVGVPDRILDYAERVLEISGRAGIFEANARWGPLSASVRKTERFKAYARKAGLVDYWKARGWPDLCRPIGADDFVCD